MRITRFALFLFVAPMLWGCSRDIAVTPAPPQTPMEQEGIPVYPGSTQVAMDLNKKPAQNGSRTAYAEYASTDDYQKVIRFYKDKLGLMSSPAPGAKIEMMVGRLPNGHPIQMYVGPNGPNNTKIQYYFILMPKEPAANGTEGATTA